MTLAATDALSGVASTYYTVDSGTPQPYLGTPILVSGGGSHAVTYWSVDAAGNREATHTGYVNIDTTAPTTTATGLAADDQSGWTNTAHGHRCPHGRGRSGSGVASTYYTVDGGDQTTYSGPFTVSGDGQHRSRTGRSTRSATPRPSTPAT